MGVCWGDLTSFGLSPVHIHAHKGFMSQWSFLWDKLDIAWRMRSAKSIHSFIHWITWERSLYWTYKNSWAGRTCLKVLVDEGHWLIILPNVRLWTFAIQSLDLCAAKDAIDDENESQCLGNHVKITDTSLPYLRERFLFIWASLLRPCANIILSVKYGVLQGSISGLILLHNIYIVRDCYIDKDPLHFVPGALW